jgi:phosphoglycolate phosphatase
MAILLFDFDGVLADTLDDMLNFARAACEQLELRRSPTRADLDALDEMSFAEYGRQLKVPSQHIETFVRLCLDMFEQRMQSPKIFEGMAQVVVTAADDHAIGIITGNTSQTVEKFLKANKLGEYVKIVMGVEQSGSKFEKIKMAAQELAEPGMDVYMIGDAVSDIRAARQASIKSIAVGWGHQSISRLETEHPDHLVNTPLKLKHLLSEI